MQRLLSAHTHPNVKLLLEIGAVTVSAALALRLARSGEYHWCGSRHRVRKMRPVQEHPWQACYRTTRAATLQPSVEWLASVTLRLD